MSYGHPNGGRYAIASPHGWFFAHTCHVDEFDNDYPGPPMWVGGDMPELVSTYASRATADKEADKVRGRYFGRDVAVVELVEV